MKFLLIFAAVLTVGSAINPAAVYRSRCSEGASYWCESAMQAKECGAVEYCIQNFWRGQMVKESPTCLNCEIFVNAVHNVLEQTTVQEDIIDGVKQACVVMGSLSDLCQTFVDTLGMEVLQKLVSELTADEVCHVLGLCKSMELSTKNDEVCDMCKDLMSEASQYLSNVTIQQDIENAILEVCPFIQAFFPNCTQMVKEEFPIIMELLLTYVNPETCTLIGLCPADSKSEIQQLFKKIMKLKRTEVGDQLCDDCKTTLQEIDAFLSNQAIQGAVILELDQLCASLGPFAPVCKYYVKTYTKEIFTAIIQLLAPDSFCLRLGFCPQKEMLSQVPVKLGADQCSDCEAFFKDIDGLLMNVTVQNMIIADLDNLCEDLGSFADQCKSYVDQYASIVFPLIAGYLDPQQICSLIGFCQSKRLTLKEVMIGSDQCTDCKAFFGDIDSMLMNQTVQNMITADLDNICEQLGSFADQCKSYVDQYAFLIFDFIASSMSPDTVCASIGFCSSMPQKVKADPQLCSDCKAFMTDLDTLLSNQTFQTEVITQLESLCSLAGNLEAECKLLVETYGLAAFSYLLQLLDPSTICTEIGFCSAQFAAVQLAVSVPKVQPAVSLQAAHPITPITVPKVSDEECDFCKIIVGVFLQELEDNKTVEEILDAVSYVCRILPVEEEVTCNNYVHDYGYLIITLLQNSLSPEDVCKEIAACTSASKPSLAIPVKELRDLLSKLPVADAPFCIVCEIIGGEIQTILSSNKSKEEIKQEVEKLLCGNLPSPVNGQCLAFMQIYGDVLIQLLIEQFEPSTFCADIGLCDSKKQLPKPSMPKPTASVECTVCEFMVSELDDLLEENSTEEEIKAALDKVCSLLPDTVRSECVSLINMYSQEIIEYLVHQYSPQALCQALKICPPADAAPSKPAQVDASQQCILCEYIMSEIDKIISENSTKEEIEKALMEVCSILPATLRTECDLFVRDYTDLIIAAILQDLPPEVFCTTIGLCDKPTVEVKKPTSSVECAICEYVLSELDSMLAENATQAEIEKALEEVCSLMPATVRTECDNFVTTYEPILIKLLLSEDPAQICTMIQLCSASLKTKLGTLECDLCQTAIREFMDALQEPSVTKEVVAIINDTCGILPEDLKAQCYSYVDQYGDLVTQFIAQFFDPITSCTLLEACPYPSNNPRKQLLGQNECTRGPGYWCASMDNAKQCNMVDHCKRHAWN